MWFSCTLFFRCILISARLSRLMLGGVVSSPVCIEKIPFAKTRRNSIMGGGGEEGVGKAQDKHKRDAHPCVQVSSSETKPTD